MKMLLKTLLLVAISSVCAHTGNAQTPSCSTCCSTFTFGVTFAQYNDQACPAGGPTADPYIILPLDMTGTMSASCTATNNVQPPPDPGTVYFSYTENPPLTALGQRYCNTNHSPYSSYDCRGIVTGSYTKATGPSDFDRFYNYAYDYKAVNGQCVQSDPTRQDFQQCQGLACQSPPCPHPTCACDPDFPDPCCCGGSPILIDIGGQGFDLTSAQNGVRFDISGKGLPFQIAWTAPGAQNAFLCLPDANGCNSGKQLFGNFTPQPPPSTPTLTPNGFAALAVYDQNGDGIIDVRDAIYSKLRLWIDSNHDGISQPNELFTLPSLGVYSISLKYKADQRTDQYGNIFRYRAAVGSTDGAGRMAYDVFFVMQTSGTAATLKACPPRPLLMKTPAEKKTLLR